MDFNKIFKYSWEIFVKDIVALLVGGIIASILSLVTLGILAGPLFGGLIKMVIRRVREKRPAEIGDVFSAMDQFGTLFVTTLVLFILIFLASLLCVIPGLLLGTIWIYALVYVVDKKLSMGEAMTSSKSLVMQNGFGMHLLMLILLGVGSGILSMTYVGGLVVTPFITVVICVMYFLCNNEEGLLLGATSLYSSQSEMTAQASNQPQVRSEIGPQASIPVINQSNISVPVEKRAEIDRPLPSQNQPQAERRVASLVCMNCGNKVLAGAFCSECGAPLKLVCSNCKKELVAGARFCPACGSKLE